MYDANFQPQAKFSAELCKIVYILMYEAKLTIP
jgi:hypothetical protein